MPKVRVNDIELNYETVGQGQSVLLIHGLGSSARDWELQIPDFANHYQVTAIDLRGHGHSDKPPGPYSIPLFARDAAELLKKLNLASAHVIGISLGGMVAYQMAVSYPEVVKSIVAVNCTPEFIIHTAEERRQVFLRKLVVRVLGMRGTGKFLSKRLFIKPDQEDMRRQFVERWAENDLRAYRASMQAILGWSVTDKLAEINCPVLMVAADEDYTPVSEKEKYLARIPQAELVVIKDSRHATSVEHPEQFNQVVMEFLAKQA